MDYLARLRQHTSPTLGPLGTGPGGGRFVSQGLRASSPPANLSVLSLSITLRVLVAESTALHVELWPHLHLCSCCPSRTGLSSQVWLAVLLCFALLCTALHTPSTTQLTRVSRVSCFVSPRSFLNPFLPTRLQLLLPQTLHSLFLLRHNCNTGLDVPSTVISFPLHYAELTSPHLTRQYFIHCPEHKCEIS